MESKKSAERLQAYDFQPEEIERLYQLRSVYREREQAQRRRLEFVRWLVCTGRMTDSLAESSQR